MQLDAEDDYDKMSCKSAMHTNKRDQDLTDSSPLNFDNVPGDVNVPIIIENLRVIALVDGGANFSSLDQNFCISNKIQIEYHPHPVPIGLADSDATGYIYGTTKPLTVYYGSKTYKVSFDVMNLAMRRSVVIGSDLMPTLGIAYTGLAVSWTPPTKHEEESPFKDVVIPNEVPYGSSAQQKHFMAYIQPSLDAN
ncbi:hypothetical protein, partial, partial [Absidia glauca]